MLSLATLFSKPPHSGSTLTRFLGTVDLHADDPRGTIQLWSLARIHHQRLPDIPLRIAPVIPTCHISNSFNFKTSIYFHWEHCSVSQAWSCLWQTLLLFSTSSWPLSFVDFSVGSYSPTPLSPWEDRVLFAFSLAFRRHLPSFMLQSAAKSVYLKYLSVPYASGSLCVWIPALTWVAHKDLFPRLNPWDPIT